MTHHVQCHLTDEKKESHYHCWLPEDYAVIGKSIEVKLDDGEWYPFIVENAWTRLPTPVVRERSQDYKKTRKASDI